MSDPNSRFHKKMLSRQKINFGDLNLFKKPELGNINTLN